MRQRATTAFLDIPSPDPRVPVRAGGIDLVDVSRLRLAVARCGAPLLARIFDPDERRACADGAIAAVTAGVFGVKESVIKAMGGLPAGGRLADIGVDVTLPDHLDARGGADLTEGGHRPVRLRGALACRGDELGVRLFAGQLPMSPGVVLSWVLGLPAEGRPEEPR